MAYHGSIYYLTEDEDGPGIELEDRDHAILRQAVIGRYHKIILRDLNPDNRDLGLYRGVERSRVNWERLCRFWEKWELSMQTETREEIGAALAAFLEREAADVVSGARKSSINCTADALEEFATALRLEPGRLPSGWRRLCCRQ